MRVLVLSADGFEDSELLVPYYRCREEGMGVEVASLARGPIKGKHGYEVEADLGIDDLRPEAYDALVVAGGRAPERLRGDPRVLELVRAFFADGRPVSAICHGPQVLLSAGVLRGRAATCYRSLARELEAGGARYRDAEVVVDGNLVTSRQPSDLPAFMRETIKMLRERRAEAPRPAGGASEPVGTCRPTAKALPVTLIPGGACRARTRRARCGRDSRRPRPRGSRNRGAPRATAHPR